VGGTAEIKKKEKAMPWCPKCWEEYPKDFTACHVCEVPLTDVKPEDAKKETETPPAAAKKGLPRYLRRRGKSK
jgi:predicted amidophosphoribosyltransferase